MTSVLVGTPAGRIRLGEGVELGEQVTALAGDWAVTAGRTLWRGTERMADLDGPAATCVLPSPAGVFVGTEEAHLLRFVDGVVEQVVSFDEAEGRGGWYTPWGRPPDVRSLSAGPDGSIYVNVHVGGILRSTDGGRGWRSTIDVDSDVHQVLAFDDELVAATAYGLARSGDGGRNWDFLTDGLHATYARAVAVAGDTVLLSVSTGPDGHRAAVYRRPLHGSAPFRRTSIGLPSTFPGNVDTFCLVADGDLAALGTFAGRVSLSDDAGGSWATGAAGPPVTCLSFT